MPQYPTKKRTIKTSGKIAESEGKRVVYKKARSNWPIYRTKFEDLNKSNQKKYVYEIKALSRQFPGKKHRIIDWGCGQGRMVSDLAKMFPDIEVIGFSRDAYSADWAIAPKNAKFLHTTKEALERYVQREKKKGKPIHLIVSNMGLEHLSLMDLTTHMKHLAPNLPIGAKILTGTLLFDAMGSSRQASLLNKAKEELKSAGYKLEFSSREKGPKYLVALQRVK